MIHIKQYNNPLSSFACSCNAAVREKNKNRSKEDQYIGFALHYYGECYGRTAAKLAKLEDQKHQEHLCIGDQSYTKCIHGHHKECVGVQFAEYVYKFKNAAPKGWLLAAKIQNYDFG